MKPHLGARARAASIALATALGLGSLSAMPAEAASPTLPQKVSSSRPGHASVRASTSRVWLARPRHRRLAARDNVASIAAANAAARDWPASGAYLNSALIYAYEPGRLYTIRTSPRFLTTITLKPGEKLIAKAAGDTVRWVLGETNEGGGDTARVVVLVKPVQAGLRTNIVLTTDQRTYLIDATSADSDVYTSLVSWNYPADLARELAVTSARARDMVASDVATGLAVDRLNFHYRVEPLHGRAPNWQPLRVFDDGAKTYVEFPADLGASEAPPLFLVGEHGQADLVNYRVKGAYYMVDRLFDVAELRLGDERQVVVRITRLDGARP